ncbi:TRAP transporter small permease [Pukyongiella litopenaei]|uniref:TRAP transporter small permease protein n=1 Tax=Pukyongiella litopenaei TaxID=2605946 RepID=A0A2S0MNI7_9RHOB|nr:TRAP transporter small permease [Pukyongiella litopenaei]AVO37438.1 TRAP transporter small permease [Pukyongiella litopenaei]
MMRSLSSFLDGIYRLGGLLAGVGLVCLCLLVLYSILARLLGLYAGGATDFAGYVMATATFLALADTFRTNGHIRVQLLVQKIIGTPRRVIEILCLAIMSGATAYLAYYLARLTHDSYDFGERSEGADAVLLWMPQTPVAFGAALLALSVLHTLIQALFDYDAVNPETSGHEGPNEV